MKGHIIRKILVVLIIIAPVFSYSGCKKQVRCGCGKDIVKTLTAEYATVYFTTGTTISFMPVNDPYSTYHFCNPGEMYPKMTDYKSGDILQISGNAYWECNYLYQSSNYSYQSMYKVYQIQVTDVSVSPYGKK